MGNTFKQHTIFSETISHTQSKFDEIYNIIALRINTERQNNNLQHTTEN
jgi:hypothetical protein